MSAITTEKCGVCSSPAEKRCGKCKRVFYCGADHQKEDWKIHRHFCVKDGIVEAVENEQFGRHLVTTCPISAGDKLLADSPLIWGPFGDKDHLFSVCLGCCDVLSAEFNDPKVGTPCQKCGWMLCKADCPELKNHADFECKIFAQANFTPEIVLNRCRIGDFFQNLNKLIYKDIYILRVLLFKQLDARKWEQICNLKQNGVLNPLECLEAAECTGFLRICKLGAIEYPDDLIQHIYGVVGTNAIGNGVDLTAARVSSSVSIFNRLSKLTHSCVKNTCQSHPIGSPDQATILFATVDLLVGTILTETYCQDTAMWMGMAERRAYLKQSYNFWCLCSRCLDPTELGTFSSGMKCDGGGCPGYFLLVKKVPPPEDGDIYDHSAWKCNNSDCARIADYVEELSKTCDTLQARIMKCSTFRERRELLVEYFNNGTVHQNHCLLIRLRLEIIEDIMKMKEYPELGFQVACGMLLNGLATQCLKVVDVFLPGKTPERANLLHAVAKGMEMKSAGLSGQERRHEQYKAATIRYDIVQLVKHLPNAMVEYAMKSEILNFKHFEDKLE